MMKVKSKLPMQVLLTDLVAPNKRVMKQALAQSKPATKQVLTLLHQIKPVIPVALTVIKLQILQRVAAGQRTKRVLVAVIEAAKQAVAVAQETKLAPIVEVIKQVPRAAAIKLAPQALEVAATRQATRAVEAAVVKLANGPAEVVVRRRERMRATRRAALAKVTPRQHLKRNLKTSKAPLSRSLRVWTSGQSRNCSDLSSQTSRAKSEDMNRIRGSGV